jgi:hypothetical protein
MNGHTAEFDAALASLVSEHAPHGFAGFMRSAKDGCQVYVAATALRDALRECVLPPAVGHVTGGES